MRAVFDLRIACSHGRGKYQPAGSDVHYINQRLVVVMVGDSQYPLVIDWD
jgi:hypothetical protein